MDKTMDGTTDDTTDDTETMRRAVDIADTARLRSRPNPWVGAVLSCRDGREFVGATEEPGGRHAEIVALDAARAAGADPRGAVLTVTLEPCSHTGRTGPCTERIIADGIATVRVGIVDPDPRVAGTGIGRLRAAGVNVETGSCAHRITGQLAPYLHHRRTGRPFVLLKIATTLDARTTNPGGPRWITGEAARRRVHELRAQSDAIIVGIGTVLADDPRLTVRDAEGPSPRRIVLSSGVRALPEDARVRPCQVRSGTLDSLLDELGSEGVVQVMVEGGPTVAGAFHRAGLVQQYVFHVAPVVSSGIGAMPVFVGDEPFESAAMRLVSTCALGDDLEIVLEPAPAPTGEMGAR